MNPRERVLMNVVREGEPKARCQYAINRAWGRAWRENRPRRVRDEVASDRRDFVWEGELTGEMGGATDLKGRTIGEGKGDSRKGFGREKG